MSVVVRSCIGCRGRFPKDRLVRLTRRAGPEVVVDASGRGGGRGAYVCADVRCWRAALSPGRVARALRFEPSASALRALHNELEAAGAAVAR